MSAISLGTLKSIRGSDGSGREVCGVREALLGSGAYARRARGTHRRLCSACALDLAAGDRAARGGSLCCVKSAFSEQPAVTADPGGLAPRAEEDARQ